MDTIAELFDDPLEKGEATEESVQAEFTIQSTRAIEAFNDPVSEQDIQNELSKPMGSGDTSDSNDDEESDEESDDEEDDKSDEEGDNKGPLEGTDEYTLDAYMEGADETNKDLLTKMNDKLKRMNKLQKESFALKIKQVYDVGNIFVDKAIITPLLMALLSTMSLLDPTISTPVKYDKYEVKHALVYYFNGDVITLVETGKLMNTTKILKDVKGTHYQNTVYRGKLINHIIE
jgi:hypothetical protein